MEMQMTRPGMGPRSTTVIGNDIGPAQLKAEHILLKRKNQLLLKKEKRIQVRFLFLFYTLRAFYAPINGLPQDGGWRGGGRDPKGI